MPAPRPPEPACRCCGRMEAATLPAGERCQPAPRCLQPAALETAPTTSTAGGAGAGSGRCAQQRPEVVDVGEGRPGDHQVAQRLEEAVGVVAVQVVGRHARCACGARQRVGRDERRRRCLRCRRCRRCRPPAPTRRSACSAWRSPEQNSPARPPGQGRALTARAHRDRGLAAGQDHAGPRKRLAVPRHGARQRRVHLAHLAASPSISSLRMWPPARPRAPAGRGLQAAAAWRSCAPRGRQSASPGLGVSKAPLPARRTAAAARRCRSAADGQRIGAGGGVGHRGAAGDDRRVVARHVADGSVTTRAGAQAAASRPPLMRERCLRTQFISSMPRRWPAAAG
jgi:hypothetical protein